MRSESLAAFALVMSSVLVACQTQSTYYPLNQTGTPAEVGTRPLMLSNSEFAADMVTPLGIRVKTNGQYKTDASRKTVALAIDRYWNEVRTCATGAEPPSDTDVHDLIDEFPRFLTVEIATEQGRSSVQPTSLRILLLTFAVLLAFDACPSYDFCLVFSTDFA